MANRSAAQYYAAQFKAWTKDPTAINQKKAQALYEMLFVNHSQLIGVSEEDFHVGEMYCTSALVTLGVHRHPLDGYLKRRGVEKVITI